MKWFSENSLQNFINSLMQRLVGRKSKDANNNFIEGAEIFNVYSGADKNIATGNYSHAEGKGTQALSYYSHAEGYHTVANGGYSTAHAEGSDTKAINSDAHAEGDRTKATGITSHAEGLATTASGECSHAEGSNSVASGDISHVEGERNTASGKDSHAEGSTTKANNYCSHSEGVSTTASGNASHAEGNGTYAIGTNSHAQNTATIASNDSGTAIGKYNNPQSNSLLEIGNGTYDNRSNILEVFPDYVNVHGYIVQNNYLLEPIQFSTLPVANASNVNKIYQYIGKTTSNYTNGYFYKNIEKTDDVTGTKSYSWEVCPTQELTKHWIGTSAEYEAAMIAGEIEDGTIIIITDDDNVDKIPTVNSTNLVESGGVYSFVQNGLNEKVDKVSGKGLSANDYTTAEKTKLASIEAEANKTVVDSALSDSSTNPVQNKVIKENLDDKYPKAWDVELTQAQYDALPASKYVDGKNYYITDGDADEPIIYGFHIDPDESDPSDAVTYLMDAVGMEPAKMGTTAFNYGSWKNAFFMPKPCMLKYDGTVDYYLDPNDFSKKVDGTASDVGNLAYGGNAMMEFPKIWFKFEAGTANGEGYFYVSNQKVDDTYRCWCNMDADGNEIDHFYMAIYNGTMPNGLSDKMRSLSGLRLTPTIDGFAAYDNTKTYNVGALCKVDSTAYQCITAVTTAEEFDAEKWQEITPNNAGHTTGQQEVNAAVANDTTAKSEWYIDTWCDRVLITALLYLMGKSLNLQATFGRGIDSGSQTAAEAYVTGAANDKGLFYGSTSNGNTVVKVFGIENFWACKWHRTAGLIGNSSGRYSYKMTASTADGSSVSGYNSNGNGYLTTTFNRPTNNYVTLMGFGAHGALPLDTTGATSTTYYCDYFYTGIGFALVGGYSYAGAFCGFYVNLVLAFGDRYWHVAAALSCKPLAQKG